MASRTDENTLCVCKLMTTGMAKDFVWHDGKAKAAAIFKSLKDSLIERFETEPARMRVQRFMSAR